MWSGARGEDRCTPTRSASACRQRLQLIRKHVDPQWLSLHTGDATLRANVIAVLEDESFQAEVDAERATLRAAADAPTDLQAHEPSDSPAPATPRSSPATAVHKGRVRYESFASFWLGEAGYSVV